MDTEQVKELLRKRYPLFKKSYYVTEMGLFGSFAKGTQKGKSDVDILVSFSKGHKDFFNYMKLKADLEELFGREVDLVVKDALKSRLKDRILDEVDYVS